MYIYKLYIYIKFAIFQALEFIGSGHCSIFIYLPILVISYYSYKFLWFEFRKNTECRRTSPNFAVNCHSPMELRPPTARKSHPNFFALCKRSTEMIKYSKTIIPNVQNTMRTQVTPMVSNYGKGLTNRYFSISKHNVNA